MNRLTNKDINWYNDFVFSLRNKLITSSEINDAIYKKLKSLEDLEEELKIDLITLFKVLKQKHVFHKENVKIEILGIHIKSNELYLYGFAEDTTHTIYLSLKEYGKTWVLTREELEDEEKI